MIEGDERAYILVIVLSGDDDVIPNDPSLNTTFTLSYPLPLYACLLSWKVTSSELSRQADIISRGIGARGLEDCLASSRGETNRKRRGGAGVVALSM